MPRTQLKVRNAILNCICWGTGSQCRTSLSTGMMCSTHSRSAGQPSGIIVCSLTNMAAVDSNGYLKSNYMLNVNNRQTKHYTYSYIHVRTFTKTEPVSLSNPTMQPCFLVKPVEASKASAVLIGRKLSSEYLISLWLNLPRLVTIRAAAFITIWSHRVTCIVAPCKTMLQ